MNDRELDDILNRWDAPSASPCWRDRVRGGFKPQRRRWLTLRPRTLVAAAAFAAVALLFIVPRALPQASPAIPGSVEFEFLQYKADGSSTVEMGATSYMLDGTETMLSRWAPSNPLKTAMWRAADTVEPAWARLSSRLYFGEETMERIWKSRKENASRRVGAVTGCGPLCIITENFNFARASTQCITGTVVGRDTILGHPAVAFQQRWAEHGRDTFWMAPDLACITLRSVYEAEQPDGRFKVVREKRAVKIM